MFYFFGLAMYTAAVTGQKKNMAETAAFAGSEAKFESKIPAFYNC